TARCRAWRRCWSPRAPAPPSWPGAGGRCRACGVTWRSPACCGGAAAGLRVLPWGWRWLPRVRRALALTGLLWGAGSWLAIAVGDYAPNRYVVPALPGLALVAGLRVAVLGERLRPPPRRTG